MFVVFAWIHHNLGATFDAFALRSPTAIVVAELVTVRLFYWHFGHTQVAFTPFVQIAGVGGAMAVSFVMFWLAEVGVRVILFGERRRSFLLPVGAFLLSLGYGALMMQTLGHPGGEMQEVLLVQGPPSLAEKRQVEVIWQNLERLYDMSRESAGPGTLVVWPEGSIPAYIRRGPGFSAERGARYPGWETVRHSWSERSPPTASRSGSTPPSRSIPTARCPLLTSNVF